MVLLLVQNSFSYWQCYARNTFGIDYWGTGTTMYYANQNALFACQANTYITGRCWVLDRCEWRY